MELAQRTSIEELNEFLTTFDSLDKQTLFAWMNETEVDNYSDEQIAFLVLSSVTLDTIAQELELRTSEDDSA